MVEKSETPDIVTHRIPCIEVYHVTDDELDRMEEKISQVSQDLTLMTTSLTAFITLLVALAAGIDDSTVRFGFWVAVVVALLIAIHTGYRWFHQRRKTLDVIRKIRSRKIDPDISPNTAEME